MTSAKNLLSRITETKNQDSSSRASVTPAQAEMKVIRRTPRKAKVDDFEFALAWLAGVPSVRIAHVLWGEPEGSKPLRGIWATLEQIDQALPYLQVGNETVWNKPLPSGGDEGQMETLASIDDPGGGPPLRISLRCHQGRWNLHLSRGRGDWLPISELDLPALLDGLEACVLGVLNPEALNQPTAAPHDELPF